MVNLVIYGAECSVSDTSLLRITHLLPLSLTIITLIRHFGFLSILPEIEVFRSNTIFEYRTDIFETFKVKQVLHKYG